MARTNPGRPEGDARPPENGRPLLPADLRGVRFAYNDPHSMSGLLALQRDLVAAGEIRESSGLAGFFGELIQTGGHKLSVIAVAEGRADAAAIDCRTWAYCRKWEPAAAQLRVIGWTGLRKGLPFIRARGIG